MSKCTCPVCASDIETRTFTIENHLCLIYRMSILGQMSDDKKGMHQTLREIMQITRPWKENSHPTWAQRPKKVNV